ncbi:3'-5' exoribonuclease HELZ2 [Paramisgurnus dabryanus]|uniref:3'-5' exoribonuclease HELZ2 n=1 Tax=Paramisgurnus dabryanus TaxID=90735 RepID=UPI0031F42A9A
MTLVVGPNLKSDPEFYQELNKKDIKECLITNPNDFKRCKLEMERHDLAYARPIDEPTLHIKITGRENVGRSFPEDEVCVEIISRKQSPWEGKVIGLINRDEECLTVICRRMQKHSKIVTPINKPMTRILTIQKNIDAVEIREHKYGRWVTKEFVEDSDNQLLIVKVIKWEENKFYPLGVVTRVISEEDSLQELLKFKLGYKDPPLSNPQELENYRPLEREKLCDHITFTIDSSKAQDLDDAISVSKINDNTYQIGIHITDVASYVRKDSEPDKFAKQLGKTIYTQEKGELTFMFSRELSQSILSLIPKKHRRAISLLIDIDKKTSNIKDRRFALTEIRSDERMSYEDADIIIQGNCFDITKPLQISCVEDCVAIAYHFSEVHRKYRLDGGWPCERQPGQSRSHAMVEELMNLYNSAVAEELISADITRDITPLRCHREPDSELLEQFEEKYVDLIPMSHYIASICKVNQNSEQDVKEVCSVLEYDNMKNILNNDKEHGILLNIFSSIFQKMEMYAQNKDYYNLMQLIVSDAIHPTLLPMVQEFHKIQTKAVIRRSCSSTDSRLGHYDLRLNAYTQASSPMRRYLDLILQRLLHTILSEDKIKQADYTQNEINEFCQSGMKVEEERDAQLLILRKFQSLSLEPKDVVRLAVVDRLTPKGHDFTISFPLHPISEVINILYRHLKIVDQPKYNEDKNSITLLWKRRVYSFKSSQISYTPKLFNNMILVSGNLWQKLLSAMKEQDWVKIGQCLHDMKEGAKKEIEGLRSEKKTEQHCKELTMELKLGQVVQVQLGIELKDGLTVPVIQLVNINENFDICLEHTRNPTECFCQTACRPSQPSYKNYKEYQDIWSQLCYIDTAYNALEENNSILLEDVPIKWTVNGIDLQGVFHITKTQRKQWSLEFDLRNCFLCIRLKHQKDENPKKKAKHLDGSVVSDLQGPLPFTWVAHGVATKKEQKYKDQTSGKIDFKIVQRSMCYIPPGVFHNKTRFTVEVIPKKIPYMLKEQAIAKLKNANHLVKSVAAGQLNDVNCSHADKNSSLYTMDKSLKLQQLNESQKRAVEAALRKPFTVIQGPPGTGKTVVGIHIVYHFFKKNKDFLATSSESCPAQKQLKKPAILYCGPSNKSVDIVAEQLLKLSGVLKPLRIYCDQMEMREFPYPGSALKLCRKSLRDEKPKKELRDITLMYLVRKPENPFSEKINYLYENMTEDKIDEYRNLLKEAYRHEIQKHDVILCTCSSALNPNLQKVIDFRQILIDECAMATEPEAFIPLVAHNPQQIVLLGDHKQVRPIVQCTIVKRMGMQQSLFERYMDLAIMLDTQYRMREEICRFPSEQFYDGKLKTEAKRGPCYLLNNYKLPTAILFGHVEGTEVSLVVSTEMGNENSVANTEQAKQAVRVAKLLITQSCVKAENIAILTPYNAQVYLIRKTLKTYGMTNVNVCTVMKSQGSEWPYVILSTVRSCLVSDINCHRSNSAWLGQKLGFIIDPNQVNVAITRAQDGLCILGNSDLLKCSDLWACLLDHYYRKGCVVNPASDIQVQVSCDKELSNQAIFGQDLHCDSDPDHIDHVSHF